MKPKTKKQLEDNLRQLPRDVLGRQQNYTKKKLEELAKNHGVPIGKMVSKVVPGWMGKLKGLW